MEIHDQQLIGKWVSLSEGALAPVLVDKTCLEFRDDGTLTYRLSSMQANEEVNLHYSSATSSAPRTRSLLIHHPVEDWQKQVPFELTTDGMLLLSLGSTKQFFMRFMEVH